MTWSDTVYLLPEIIIAFGACVLLIAPVTRFRGVASAKWTMLVLLAVTARRRLFARRADIPRPTPSMFALDGFAIFAAVHRHDAMVTLLRTITFAARAIRREYYPRRSHCAGCSSWPAAFTWRRSMSASS
jgi:hypothetical protein